MLEISQFWRSEKKLKCVFIILLIPLKIDVDLNLLSYWFLLQCTYMCCTTLVEINLKMLLIEEDFLMLLMGFCYFIIISSRRGEMLELNQLVSFTSDSPSQDFAWVWSDCFLIVTRRRHQQKRRLPFYSLFV